MAATRPRGALRRRPRKPRSKVSTSQKEYRSYMLATSEGRPVGGLLQNFLRQSGGVFLHCNVHDPQAFRGLLRTLRRWTEAEPWGCGGPNLSVALFSLVRGLVAASIEEVQTT